MAETMGDDGIIAALQGMSPEQLAQLLKASNAPNRSSIVQQQLQRAQGLQDAPMDRHSNPVGALFGGLAHALRAHQGMEGEQAAQGEQERLMGLLENPQTAALTFGGGAAPAAPGAPMAGQEDLSAFVAPLPQNRLGAGGMVGGMGMDKQKMLADLLRSTGGAGDLSMLAGLV